MRWGPFVLFEDLTENGVVQGERIPTWGRNAPECASNWQTEAELAGGDEVPAWDDAKRVLDIYKRADWGGLQVSRLNSSRCGYLCI